MKKLVSIAVAIVLIVLMTSPALAHSARHTGRRSAGYAVCPLEDCAYKGSHIHEKKIYTPHYYGDGHDYHGYCDVEDCVLGGYHSHDGNYCFGRADKDGQDYQGYCGFSGCTVTGYHEHSGQSGSGNTSNDGYNYHHAGKGHH